MGDASEQVAEALRSERESLSPECRADAARLERLLAPDPQAPPITVENMRGFLLADGLAMVKYVATNAGRRTNRTSLWRRVAPGHWQMFHHQGTVAAH